MKTEFIQRLPTDERLLNHHVQLPVILEKIISLTNPNRIYLINSISACNYFTNNSLPDQFKVQTHYNLMIVSAQSENLHTVQEAIENNCNPILPLTAFVLPEIYYKHFRERNSVFANGILASGELLYKAENAIEAVEDIQIEMDIEKECRDALKRARGFLLSAGLLLLANEIPLAAFALRQAIEEYCYGKILGHLGVNPMTHNLDKLYRLMRFFTFELVKVFPRDTEIEERLFGSVKDAYIASRYSASCAVKSTDLTTIRDRLRILFQA